MSRPRQWRALLVHLSSSSVGLFVFKFIILLCFTLQARSVVIPKCVLMSSSLFASLLMYFVLDCAGDILEGINGLHSKRCGLSKLFSVFIIEMD